MVAVYYYLFSSFKISSIHCGPNRVFFPFYWDKTGPGRCWGLAVFFFPYNSHVLVLMLEVQMGILKDVDHKLTGNEGQSMSTSYCLKNCLPENEQVKLKRWGKKIPPKMLCML